MKIYIASHKEFMIPQVNVYTPLLVGADKNIANLNSKAQRNYLKDNTGDNISDKNPNYCELTGLYWVWKNENVDTVGLVHYRRYFTKKIRNKVLDETEIEKLLNGADILLPAPYYLRKDTVWTDYANRHSDEELLVCREILTEKYPDYLEAFETVFAARKFYTFNMFVTSKVLFDEYCEWLFEVLFEVEEKIDISSRDSYNQRVYGFLSERLLNVWVAKKQLSIKEVTVKNTESSNLKDYFKNKVKKLIVLGG